MSNLLNEKFSSRAKNALKTAQMISRELRDPFIGTQHLLYGIVSELSSFASEVLLKNRVSLEVLRLELKLEHDLQVFTNFWRPRLSKNLREALLKAVIVASKYQYQFIGTEHFLYGIVEQDESRAKKIMRRIQIDPLEIKKNLLAIFENVSKFPNVRTHDQFHEALGEQSSAGGSALEYFTTDLTQKAKEGRIDPLIGRKAEVERLISILNRRTKNNPVLLGESGVGKTAIVEGLALAIMNREVPDSLLDKKILALDLALLVAGSMFRGEFENRLKQVIDDIKDLGDVILFIDELHTVVGAGAAAGSLDAANILKPALARGELRAIGATTLTEYKKHVEGDPALERRFQPILVREPSQQETLDILRGLRPFYESHHGVKITDQALEAAVKLSARYLSERFFPDKAIDVTDETAAFYKIAAQKNAAASSFSKIERDLLDLADQKRQAVFSYDFPKAQNLRSKEHQLLNYRDKLLKEKSEPADSVVRITDSHVANTVARITGIPAPAVLKEEAQKVLALEKNLLRKIVGQKEVIGEIAAAIRRARAGISAPTRPSGSFMFLGPTGVGKTLTAKYLAAELFGSPEALLRIDMSELMERHNVARLIGAPAGYVGFEEGGRLTEAVRQRPYRVILFDEIEKAHRDVIDILLQILEEGELTDAAGKKVNFRNTVIILTSNIGQSSLNKLAKSFGFEANGGKASEALDPDQIKHQVLLKLREQMRPEFLNRIDKILIFNPLTRADLKKIVKLELEKLKKRLAEQKIGLIFSPAVANYLTEISFDPSEGARLVRKNLQDLLEDQIAQGILRGEIKAHKTLTCKVIPQGQPGNRADASLPGKQKSIEIT